MYIHVTRASIIITKKLRSHSDAAAGNFQAFGIHKINTYTGDNCMNLYFQLHPSIDTHMAHIYTHSHTMRVKKSAPYVSVDNQDVLGIQREVYGWGKLIRSGRQGAHKTRLN